MLTIARALMGNPLLFLNKPCEGLAPLAVAALVEQVSQLKRGGLAILRSEQNLRFATALSDRVYMVDNGTIPSRGALSELGARGQESAFDCLTAQVYTRR